MLALHPDWRWGEFYKMNPYPSLTIYKQIRFNDWSNVEAQIYEDLKKKYPKIILNLIFFDNYKNYN